MYYFVTGNEFENVLLKRGLLEEKCMYLMIVLIIISIYHVWVAQWCSA